MKKITITASDLKDEEKFDVPYDRYGRTKGSLEMIHMGEHTEKRLLKMLEKEKYLTAFGVAKISDIPARTAGSGLDRLANKGLVIESHEMKKSADGRNHLNHIYRLAKKNGRKRNK